jgi:KDO2-lipid IV(A) lauroyltransferase
VISLFFKLLSRLSLKNIQRVGAILGMLAYISSSRYRELLKIHLDAAAAKYHFKPDYWTSTKESGKTLADCLWIWSHPKEALAKTHIQNWEVVQAAVAEGKGLIMLTPHFGGFEIIPRVLAEHFPATILYRPARQEWLNDIIESGRRHPRMIFAPANLQGVRMIAKALQRGEAVGILPDQVPKDSDGVWAKFFGQYAYTVTLPAKIAGRNNVPTIVFTAIRLPSGQGWELHAKRMNENFDNDPLIAAQQMNDAIERSIIQKPEQYLWAYNRFKHPAGAEPRPEESKS